MTSTSVKQDLNSIDLLEDCLKQIYWARRSNLLARIKRSKEKQDNCNSVLFGESTEKSLVSGSHGERINNAILDLKKEEIDDRIASSHTSSPKKLFQVTPINKAQYLDMKKRSKNSSDSSKDDTVAVSLYDNFLNEVSKWLRSNPQGVKDENLRGEFADFLVDKYLSSKLDLYERSEMVANIRKQVSNDIEEFASVGTPPSRNQDIISTKQQLIQNNSIQQPKPLSSSPSGERNTDDLTEDSNAPPPVQPPPPVPPVSKPFEQDREKQQKEKIKSQYENFVNTKKKVSLHPDNKMMQEYSDLNQDIQSLLSSLQNGKTIKS